MLPCVINTHSATLFDACTASGCGERHDLLNQFQLGMDVGDVCLCFYCRSAAKTSYLCLRVWPESPTSGSEAAGAWH